LQISNLFLNLKLRPTKSCFSHSSITVNLLKLNIKIELVLKIGKASAPDQCWPDQIDHQNPELNVCCLSNCILSVIRPDFEVAKEGRILHLTINTKPKKIGWSYK
jgi:hypothetical protein